MDAFASLDGGASSRLQEDTYVEPENFLEISIGSPQNHGGSYTSYLIETNTNIPTLPGPTCHVRRRYSEFVELRRVLIRECPRVVIPPLPARHMLSASLGGTMKPEFVEQRRAQLEGWLRLVVGHPLVQVGSKSLQRFLSEQEFVCR
ncbi:Snx3 protein [Martiniozyma asiatica (nom. inval.)]|nr:Snx3 protein [Martiniozyma asiatica]